MYQGKYRQWRFTYYDSDSREVLGRKWQAISPDNQAFISADGVELLFAIINAIMDGKLIQEEE